MSKEVTVILKDSERTCKHKFLIYEDFSMSLDDDTLKTCVESARKSFFGNPEDIQIRCVMVYQ